jgi:ABC-type amino acid transport system permease subunit
MSLDFSFLTLKVINNIILTGLIFSIKLTLISMVLGIILGTLTCDDEALKIQITKFICISLRNYCSIYPFGNGYSLGFFINSFIYW